MKKVRLVQIIYEDGSSELWRGLEAGLARSRIYGHTYSGNLSTPELVGSQRIDQNKELLEAAARQGMLNRVENR